MAVAHIMAAFVAADAVMGLVSLQHVLPIIQNVVEHRRLLIEQRIHAL